MYEPKPSKVTAACAGQRPASLTPNPQPAQSPVC